ncbi:MAG TPA: EboA domain-containing protein [Pseudonocardiaceae bacterium]
MSEAELRAAMDTSTAGEEARRWLVEACARVRTEPQAIRTLFPAAARRCGRGPLPVAGQRIPWTVDLVARALLLCALPLQDEPLADEVDQLYRYGDAAEKRAVLYALHLLPLGDRALPVVRDALRTNDTRLVAAALGPYGATHLDGPAWRQGVLKCVFLGIPLDRVHGLPERADAELARMMVDFARERIAAGRDVPADIWPVVNRHPQVVAAARLDDELHSSVPARREAARRALAAREAARVPVAPQDR